MRLMRLMHILTLLLCIHFFALSKYCKIKILFLTTVNLIPSMNVLNLFFLIGIFAMLCNNRRKRMQLQCKAINELLRIFVHKYLY